MQGLGIARRRSSPPAIVLSPPSTSGGSAGPTAPSRRRPLRPFRRSIDDSVLGGVCAGLAARLAVKTTAVRVAAVVSIFLGGVDILAYMATWVLVPAAGEKESIASRVVADRRELQIVLALSSALFAVKMPIPPSFRFAL